MEPVCRYNHLPAAGWGHQQVVGNSDLIVNSSHVYRLGWQGFLNFREKIKRGGISISLSSQPNLLSLIISLSLQELYRKPPQMFPFKLNLPLHVREVARHLYSGIPAVCAERGERRSHLPGERPGCPLPPLPGHFPSSWTGLINQWLTKPYLPRFIICSKLWRSRNMCTESSWSSLALTTLVPYGNRNPEKMMLIEQILGKSMTWVLGVLCVGPHTPTSLSRQHSPWYSAMMGFPIVEFFVFVHFLNSYYLL